MQAINVSMSGMKLTCEIKTDAGKRPTQKQMDALWAIILANKASNAKAKHKAKFDEVWNRIFDEAVDGFTKNGITATLDMSSADSPQFVGERGKHAQSRPGWEITFVGFMGSAVDAFFGATYDAPGAIDDHVCANDAKAHDEWTEKLRKLGAVRKH